MKNIAIFASGGGTNAENITRTFQGGSRVRVAVCVTNRKNAGVVARMEALGVPVLYFPNEVWAERPSEIVEALKAYDIDLIALAGFLREVRPEILDAYPGRILNIHPSLLPSFGGKGMYGHKVHEAVIEAGEKHSGATVHFATSEIDGGEVVMQGIVELAPGETPDSLADKVHEVEMELYPRAIAKVLSEQDAPAAVPPPVPEPKPASPDRQWAEALHMPLPDEDKDKEKETARRPEPPVYRPQEPPVPPVTETPAIVADPVATVPAIPDVQPMKAKSYLALSIIFMILFGVFPAIIALIYSIKTRSRNTAGDYTGAEKASRVTQGWLIATFCLGVLFMTLYLPVVIAAAAFI